jgi:hypothetical protein
MRTVRGTTRGIAMFIGGMALLTLTPLRVAAQACSAHYDSTFELIQKAIFENRGCTSSVCHSGPFPAGGLDLSGDGAYDELVQQPATTVPGWQRVVPGQKDLSLLFVNLAAKTLPDTWHAPLRPMPLDPLPALTIDQLEAMRLWIEKGAPRTGVVEGTGELLDACLPPPEPIEIAPLDPPPAGVGVQLHMPPWELAPHSEREVCFASYYDITDQVPEEFRGPNGTFRYKKIQIRQEPLSHHLIVNVYHGDVAPNDPVWGAYTCNGGEHAGESCNPTDLTFCGEGTCATTPVNSVACIGFGPGDGGVGLSSFGLTGSQETATTIDYVEGVYNQAPLKGLILWNSHAFNLTDKPGKLEAWINFEFAAPEEQQKQVQGIFDTSKIFATDAPPFTSDEICQHHLLPPNAELFELSSHNHKRGKRFRTFLGSFSCVGGPNDGQPCDPLLPDEQYGLNDMCASGTQGEANGRCQASNPPAAGDCDGDLAVEVGELVTGVNIALGKESVDACPPFDVDGNSSVSVDEVVAAVSSAINPLRDPMASLLYTNLLYNDPLVLRLDPPMSFPGPGSPVAARTLTYCSLYDNGYTQSDEVKKKSTSPAPSIGGSGGILGGPCKIPTGCTEGLLRASCVGDSDAARNASCDSSPGAGDGMCDACTLTGGVTTEDEMFILMGSYFIR